MTFNDFWRALGQYLRLSDTQMRIVDRVAKLAALVIVVCYLANLHRKDDESKIKILTDQFEDEKAEKIMYRQKCFDMVEHHIDYVGTIIEKDSMKAFAYKDSLTNHK